MDKVVKVLSIHKRFPGVFLNKAPENEERTVAFPGFTRLGFELAGVFLSKNIKVAVCWGKLESDYLNTLSKEKEEETLRNILSRNPPLFVLSKNFKHAEKLVEINKECNENRSAIIHSELTTAEINTLIGSWLSKAFASWKNIHATVLNIWGEGVLLIGEPGVGKSETASELIRLNHLFLGDDAISVARLGNIVIAKPNEFTKDFIHLRGLGILNIKEMYGGAKIISETQISVVIELKNCNLSDPHNEKFENLGETTNYYDLVGVKIPKYTLPVTTGRNMSDLIELAVIDMKLKKQGYNAVKEMDRRFKQNAKKNN